VSSAVAREEVRVLPGARAVGIALDVRPHWLDRLRLLGPRAVRLDQGRLLRLVQLVALEQLDHAAVVARHLHARTASGDTGAGSSEGAVGAASARTTGSLKRVSANTPAEVKCVARAMTTSPRRASSTCAP